MSINIGAFLTKRAMLSPNMEGLVCEDLRLNWLELNSRANKLAHAMRRIGVKHGDRVGMLALNEPEYYDMLFGLGKIGAILVPINYRLAGPEMEYILSDCEASVFVFGKEYVEIVESFREKIPVNKFIAISESPPEWAESFGAFTGNEPEVEPDIAGGDDDTLSILYTSGTTGRPKGVMLSHNNYFWTSVTLMSTLKFTGENMLVALPLFHIGALGPVPMYAHMGFKVVLLRSLDPTRFLELIQEEKIHCFGSVPALLNILKLAPDFEKYDWSSVQIILVYAAPVPVTLIKEYDDAGIEIRQLYGLTECTGPATVIDSENAIEKAGSCGLPFFHNDIRLIDDGGNDVAPGERGEVLINGDGVMKGYWNNPGETAKSLKEGWLYTGDIARMDSDGYLYIMDRKKDMIISGGENIYPAEIEDYILSNPKVADVGVIGFPHDTWGEAVKAVVVVKQGDELSEGELIDWCKGKMGKFKIPKSVVFTDSLPRTPTGKILKHELRDSYNK